MTDCITATVDFTPLGRRQVVADFLGGRLTSDGGALLLREVDRRIRLLDAVNESIPDPPSVVNIILATSFTTSGPCWPSG